MTATSTPTFANYLNSNPTDRLQMLKQQNKMLKQNLESMLSKKKTDDIENVFRNKLAHVKINKSVKKTNQTNKIYLQQDILQLKTANTTPIKRLCTDRSEQKTHKNKIHGKHHQRTCSDATNSFNVGTESSSKAKNYYYLEEDKVQTKQNTQRTHLQQNKKQDYAGMEILKTKRRVIYQKQNTQENPKPLFAKLKTCEAQIFSKAKQKLRNTVYLEQ